MDKLLKSLFKLKEEVESSGMYEIHIDPESLKKYDEKKYGHIHDTHTAIPTGDHTVEIHPHIDHLYNIKGHIEQSGKGKLKVQHLKQAGFSKDHLNKLKVPRDADGWITPEAIDKHIESLPKQKVNITVVPYDMSAQQHRKGQQHVVSVKLHDDTLKNMSSNLRDSLQSIMDNQHHFDGTTDTGHSHPNQAGWARIDPKGHHWHVDEIQSDFNNHDKIKTAIDKANRDKKVDMYYDSVMEQLAESAEDKGILHDDYVEANYRHYMDKYIEDRTTDEERQIHDSIGKELHEHLSHGHDDPQHAIHSAMNQLARKHNVQSISMDMPNDQAVQSGLGNPHLKSAVDKVGGPKAIQKFFENSHYTRDDWFEQIWSEFNMNKLSKPEQQALQGRLEHHLAQMHGDDHIIDRYSDNYGDWSEDDSIRRKFEAEAVGVAEDQMDTFNTAVRGSGEDLPVHQINTYNKRPKKLGMKPHDKNEVLGEDPDDDQEEVQYHKLHKTLLRLREALKKC